MAKPQQILINNFSGGVSDDPRKSTASEFIISKHFNIFSQPNRLIPYRSFRTDMNDGSTSTGMKQYAIQDFLYHSSSSKLYGLGINASGYPKIVYKSDATTGNWTLPASSEGNALVQRNCFVEYKDYLWGFQGTNQVWKWGTLSGTPSITNSVATVGATITSVANGVIAKDDNLYLPYNNIIGRVTSGGTYNDAVLTLPTNLKITSLANYGNYLAIGCSPKNSYNGQSKVFIWNLTSTDIQETVDWGEGDLRVLENIEGMLVGVTDRYLHNSTGAGRGSMIIQVYSGGTPNVVKEIFTEKISDVVIPLSKSVKNNRLFFACKIYTNSLGTEYNEGIWSFGRKNVNYPYALTLDLIDENINSSGIQGFGSAGNFFFISHSGDGSIDSTNDSAAYTFTSIYESQIFNLGDVSTTHQMLQFSIFTAPIIAGSVTIKYKKDDDSVWRTMGTLSDVGEVAHDFYNNEYDGTDFATWGEIRFRIESTGGVEVTGFKFIAMDLIGSTNKA